MIKSDNLKEQFALALNLLEGKYVEKDIDKAIKLLESIALCEDACDYNLARFMIESAQLLGDIYYYGKDVEQDFTKASKWYGEAANIGTKISHSIVSSENEDINEFLSKNAFNLFNNYNAYYTNSSLTIPNEFELLGKIYEEGLVVEPELELAKKLRENIRVIKNDKSFLRIDAKSILNMDNPNLDLQLEAIENATEDDLECINYCDTQLFCEEALIECVKKFPRVIDSIYNPTENVQLAAVSIDGTVIKYITNPSEDVQMAAVTNYDKAIDFIDNPAEKVVLKAFETYSEAFRYIGFPTQEQKHKAIEMDPKLINYIYKPSKDLVLKSFETYPDAIKHLYTSRKLYDYPSYEMELSAVKRNPELIKYVSFPNEELQLIAVNGNPFTLNLIEFPTMKTIEVAKKMLDEHINNKKSIWEEERKGFEF